MQPLLPMYRFRPGAVVVALLLLLSALPARAVGRVIPSLDGPVQLDELRVAVALSPGRTTLWASFRVSGTAKHAAVVLPVVPGSLVDPASDAWFRALESATAPRVMPAGTLPACVEGAGDVKLENTARDAPTTTLHPLQIAVLASIADLDDYAAAHQLALSPVDRALLDVPDRRLVVLLFALPQGSPPSPRRCASASPPSSRHCRSTWHGRAAATRSRSRSGRSLPGEGA